MTGETAVAAGNVGRVPYDDIESARDAIAAAALLCVQGHFPDGIGSLPKEGFAVLFPVGTEEHPSAGSSEVEVSAALVFSPAVRPAYQGEGEAVPDGQRFVGVSKVIYAPVGSEPLPGGVPVGVGNGSVRAGVPVAGFYLHGFASGSPDKAVQDAAELTYLNAMGDVLGCVAAGPDYDSDELHAMLDILCDRATSLRTSATE